MTSTIVVVGGGLAGLAAATLLSRNGHNVHLLEQQSRIGGKVSTLSFDGCTFDVGPSLVTMPFVLEEFFAKAGTTLASELDLCEVDPGCQYRWADGSIVDVPSSVDGLVDAIGSISAKDAKAVRRYMMHAKEVYEATKDVFLFSPFRGLREIVSLRNLRLLPKWRTMRFTQTLHNLHSEYFSDPRVIQLFDRYATYNGSSPYRAPATLMVIPWVEHAYGAWYPRGGIRTIAEAFGRVAERNGVHIHCNATVQRIQHRGRRVHGVVLADGSEIEANHVISNVDVHVTNRMLLGTTSTPPRDPSTAAYIIAASVEADGNPSLRHHTVCFSENYQQEFAELSTAFPTSPTVYISRSCQTDSSQAGAGLENWFMLVNAPATGSLSGKGHWQHNVEEFNSRVFNQIARMGLQPNVRNIYTLTPDDLAPQWGAWGGSIYGSASNTMFSAFLRQPLRSSQFSNMWYVGGTAHPGGGIPLVTVSGMLAADAIGLS